jgi:hypothetical protein
LPPASPDNPLTPEPGPTGLLVIGGGYTGARLAAAWRRARSTPVRTSRRMARASDEFSLDFDAALPDPPASDGRLVVWTVPPPAQGDTDPRLAAGLAWLSEGGRPTRLIYLSTTGVYGESPDWIDETTPPAPDGPRGRRRLAAEDTAFAWGEQQGVAVTCLRVAAIYGPGRLPRQRLEDGRPIDPELAARPTNRIHVDDLVAAVLAAGMDGAPAAIYNVCDGRPVPWGEYLDHCADRLGLPRLARERGLEEEPVAAWLGRERRISNRRLMETLRPSLRYVDYRAGVNASVAEETAGQEVPGRG